MDQSFKRRLQLDLLLARLPFTNGRISDSRFYYTDNYLHTIIEVIKEWIRLIVC